MNAATLRAASRRAKARIAGGVDDFETILGDLIDELDAAIDGAGPDAFTQRVINAAADTFHLSPHMILGHRRTRAYARARHAVVHVLYLNGMSRREIARNMSRDDATISNSLHAVRVAIGKDAGYAAMVQAIAEAVG